MNHQEIHGRPTREHTEEARGTEPEIGSAGVGKIDVQRETRKQHGVHDVVTDDVELRAFGGFLKFQARDLTVAAVDHRGGEKQKRAEQTEEVRRPQQTQRADDAEGDREDRDLVRRHVGRGEPAGDRPRHRPVDVARFFE